MGTKGIQPLLPANREGFPEEVTSDLPLEREVGRTLRLDGKREASQAARGLEPDVAGRQTGH